jgi:hypothetical protein
VANKTDSRDSEAKTQNKEIKMLNKKCEKPGKSLNMILTSTLIAPILARSLKETRM